MITKLDDIRKILDKIEDRTIHGPDVEDLLTRIKGYASDDRCFDDWVHIQNQQQAGATHRLGMRCAQKVGLPS